MSTVKEKIPMLVNGSLSEEDKLEVLDAISKNPELEKEYQFEKKLREGLQSQEQDPPNDLVLAKIKKSIREESKSKPAISSWWRTGAVAACAMLVLQSVVVFQNSDNIFAPSSDIQLLGETQGADIQIVFRGNASFSDIQMLLQSVNATIVSGPSALGIVELRLDGDATGESVVQRLIASNVVVEATLLDSQ